MTSLWVALGAAVGAPLRYLVDRAVAARVSSRFPWGTFTVNVAGSLLAGGLAAAAPALPGAASAALAIGFCGALTTYSTFGLQTWQLLERRLSLVGSLNVAASVGACVGAAGLGWLVVGALLS